MASQDRAAMHQAAERTGEAFETINGIRGQVQTHKSELLATWESDSAMTFGQVMDKWDEKTRNVLQALNDLRDGLGAAKIKYQVTEDEQQQGVSKIDGLINNL